MRTSPTATPLLESGNQHIRNFVGEYAWLSPEYIWDGYRNSIAHEYAMLLVTDETVREWMRLTSNSAEARFRARTAIVRGRIQTDNGRLHALLYSRYMSSPEMASKLVGTGFRNIIYTNTRHDYNLGMCCCPMHNGFGNNLYGIALMSVRTLVKRYIQVYQ